MNSKAKAMAKDAASMHAAAPEVRAAGGAAASDADGWDLAAIDRDLREAGVEPTDSTREAYRAAIRAHLSALGRRGGSAKSPRKAASSEANGRKGGRPPLPRYAVRVMGQSAYTRCDTLAEARRERDTADRVCQRGHVVVDSATGRVVG